MLRRPLLIRLLAALTLVAGCDDPADETALDDPRQFASLAHLKGSQRPALREEIARIEAEGGLPRQLAAADPPPADENLAAVLRDLFPPAEAERHFEKSDGFFPPGRFDFDALALTRAAAFNQRHEAKLRRLRAAIDLPACDFRIDHASGRLADVAFVANVRLAARLEAFAAGGHLEEPDLPAALGCMARMLRLADGLGAEKHVVCRLQAAHVRREALKLLEAIVAHPAATRAQILGAYELLAGQLESWPPDADAWIGDRASGLHAYEMLQAGHVLSLLPDDHIQKLREKGAFEPIFSQAPAERNADAHFYLLAMRNLIDACSWPFHQRRETLLDVRRRIDERRGTSEYPWVAAHWLLADVERGMELQARDRADCEAWTLGLASVLDRPRPAEIGERNPLTGRRWEVLRHDDHTVVQPVDGLTVRIPHPAE